MDTSGFNQDRFFPLDHLRNITGCTHDIQVRHLHARVDLNDYLIISHGDDGPLQVTLRFLKSDPERFWSTLIEEFTTAFPHQRDPSGYSDSEYRSMVESL